MIILIIVIIIAFILVKILNEDSSNQSWIFESPARRAGRKGEQYATEVIQSVLREDDHLLTNVEISYKDRPAELDNVIVNQYGVFIIEVKNYNGTLEGEEDDYEWTKYHTTDAGNTYSKTVKNPIKQVKRQVYLLAKYLETYSSTRVWIEGYAFLLKGNSPIESKYVLETFQDIDSAVHTFNRNRLTSKEMDEILRILS